MEMLEDLRRIGRQRDKSAAITLLVCGVVMSILGVAAGNYGFEGIVLIIVMISVFLFGSAIVRFYRAHKQDPAKWVLDFCHESEDYEAVLERLQETWRNGAQYWWGWIDSEYILIFRDNGQVTVEKKIIPLDGFVKVSVSAEVSSLRSGAVARDSSSATLTFYTARDVAKPYVFGNVRDTGFAGPNMAVGIIDYIRTDCPNIEIADTVKILDHRRWRKKNFDMSIGRYEFHIHNGEWPDVSDSI
ncbi:MAG: hypothetical protein FWB75_01220 [Oscillospiraceae bacterium]|nr:hypothetical protein [Oscillospiraceae bacterium]